MGEFAAVYAKTAVPIKMPFWRLIHQVGELGTEMGCAKNWFISRDARETMN